MPERQSTSGLLVIADDFTGANDAGVCLGRYGTRVHVVLDAQQSPVAGNSEAVVICTDSRAMNAADAARATIQAIQAWREGGNRGQIIKKIDSTLRGNLGAEIEAALQAADLPMAIVAPAAPSSGRVTRSGCCWVHGRPLVETEFASDPKTPIESSRIAELLARQTDLKCAELPLEDVRHPQLASCLNELKQDGTRLVILDAETRQDLSAIASACELLPFSTLLVGAADLSETVARQHRFTPASPRPLLAVIGSMSELAQQQIRCAAYRHDVTLVDVDIRKFLQKPDEAWLSGLVTEICNALASGHHCVIRTCQQFEQRNEIVSLVEQSGLSRQQLGDRIKQALGEITRQVVLKQPPAGLYLSGGDIAIAVAGALGASGFDLHGQVAGCVPWGRLLNSIVGEIPVMTKAGAFGVETTLLDVLRFIEER